MTPAEIAVRAAIAQRGPIPFEEVVELALYHLDGGFYAAGARAGRQGDFLTSPEVGPLFGVVVGRALDGWWEEAGRPIAFTVVEAGAGAGTLRRSVLRASPACLPALRYLLVERSAAQRATHSEPLPLATSPDAGAPTSAGPVVASLADLPHLPGPCIVLANELLDNLPFGLAESTGDGWVDVRVGLAEGALVEVLVPSELGGPADAPVGARAPRQALAGAWVRDALELAGTGGRVVAIDYASTTQAMAHRPWTDWVRTYRGHQRGGHPLDHLGLQDITCEVAVDQLPPPASDRSQADWLRTHGIDELVEEGRRTWNERAAIGDLAAVRARSRISEAAALVDPAGLGAFRVLEWHA